MDLSSKEETEMATVEVVAGDTQSELSSSAKKGKPMKRTKINEESLNDDYNTEDDGIEPNSEDNSDVGDLKFEKMDIDTQMKRRRRKSEPEDDDWFGSDFSCCFCIPIALGVKLIGVWWVVNFAGLVW